ncbi:glutamate--tRNA ligase [Candidatus Micrarchaeota archaeon]|nr:glutamate--tRNA ligase [Candidatus Micrarchaeota archaeon]
MNNFEEIIRKHVLKNAFDYGKANAGAVAGKVIAEHPDAKNDMKATMALINKIIAEVSTFSKNEIEERMKRYAYAEKKEEKKELELPNAVMGKVVTRFPPEPSGYPHIGHAKAAWLDYESARVYEGKMILRFDDTNPEKEKQEYVEAIKNGLSWLGIKWDKESYTSDSMPEIYDYLERLIHAGKAYVCTCPKEEMSRRRASGEECGCRTLSKKEALERWKGMLDGKYQPGDVAVRYAGDLKSQNTVMRDPSLARIMLAEHFRQGKKYRVWPSYDFAVAIIDHLEGKTHPMRSKEYELRDELYYSIFSDLGFEKPHLVEFSRLAIKNAPISKRLLKPLVDEGKVSGWDDPRLPTLAGLARRGILPEAIRNFVLSLGLSKSESEPGWELLLAENRKMLDPVAKHYFFVRGPVVLNVKGLEQKAKIPLHPKKGMGFREFDVSGKVYISWDDAEALREGEVFRLKDLCNVKLTKKKAKALEGELAEDSMVPKKIQWVADKHKIACELLIPHDLLDENGNYNPNSLEIAKGYCEKGCTELKKGETIQFERLGFCRLDKKGKKLQFVFSC